VVVFSVQSVSLDHPEYPYGRLMSQRGHSAFVMWVHQEFDLWFHLWEPGDVRIVTERRIREFIDHEPRSADAMRQWADAIESGSGRNPSDLKGTFASAAFVGDLTIFNVGGNKYRIAAFVHYRKQIVYIKMIGTHKEYDRWDL
jgi:mRNA interferase HigB